MSAESGSFCLVDCMNALWVNVTEGEILRSWHEDGVAAVHDADLGASSTSHDE